MSIFSRLSDIVNANLNALLDRAEDPEKMVRLMVQEMEDTLVEVRSSAVKAIADKKDIVRRLERMEAERDEWEKKAEFAISKGREDLAKGALLARRKLSDAVETLKSELVVIDETLAKYNEDLSRLQAKLDEARAKQKAVSLRMQAASKRAKMRRTLYDGRIDEALSRFDGLERKIDRLEGEAEVYDMGHVPDLGEAFADLEAEEAIAEEFAALKARMAAKKTAKSGGKNK